MRALLIPSATLIPREMRSQMGALPACLFPLQNSTMLERICKKYQGHVDKIYAVVGQEKEKVYDYVRLKKLPVCLIDIDELLDVGHTIAFGFREILAENDGLQKVYINFGDTLLSNPVCDDLTDAIYFARELLSPDWTYFECRDGILCEIRDKQGGMTEHAAFGNAFTGVFEIAHPGDLARELSKARPVLPGGIDTFYQALVRYSAQHPINCRKTDDWFDVGHSDRYVRAKVVVAARSFNSIEIDTDRGTLTKRSKNRSKLIDEIKWYLKIPNKLQYLLPRIYDYSLEWRDPYVTMEYYGYDSLHEMLVYGSVTDQKWRKIFEKLLLALQDMGNYRCSDDLAQRRKAMESVYTDKTVSRLEELRDKPAFSAFFDNRIVINGREYFSLDECIKKLPGIINERLLAKQTPFCVIHGDLCFANILVESDHSFLRVIDPRGSFGSYDIYGDQRYELAKLMHSLDGGYDFIIEDMFTVHAGGSSITLDKPGATGNAYLIFLDVFKDHMADYWDLKLIESLLFLSMIPLHGDHPNRQYAMLATGIQLLDEAIGGDRYGR